MKILAKLIFLMLSQSFVFCGLIGSSRDESSHANIDEVVTRHLALDLDVDFEQQVLRGKVTLNMETMVKKVDEVYLDVVGIEVDKAEFLAIHDGEKLWTEVPGFNILKVNTKIGDVLQVKLP